MKGLVINRGASEIVVNVSTVKYTGTTSVEFAGTVLNEISAGDIASLEAAIAAYQPGGGGGGDYSQGYADGEAAKESAIASSQAVTANLYKSKLASEDATIAAADSTDIDGQGTIFSESYSYLKTSAEMQANYNSGYTAGETAGYASGYSAGETAGETTGKAAVATSQQPIASDYKSLLSGVDQTIAAADPTTLAGQLSIFNESYQYLNTGGGSGTPFTKDDFIKNFTPSREYIWTDGTDMYYSNAGVNYVLDTTTSIWRRKVWGGYSIFYGYGIWTDGTNIYYSYGNNKQYVLDTATSRWRSKTWSVIYVSGFYGSDVWTDGTNIYYSRETYHYVLDVATSTWSTKTWTGLTSFRGSNIWSDGTNIYYSSSSTQYVLDKSTSTWSTKTWTGLTSFNGNNVWTDGTNIYYSSASGGQYVLDVSTSTWNPKTWTGLTSLSGYYIWSDGTNIYYSYTYYDGSDQYVLDVATSTWTPKTWYEPYSIPSDVKLLSNRTFYEFSDIDMSFKPKSNNP